MSLRHSLVCGCAALVLVGQARAAVTFQITYFDGPTAGFNDPVLGAARRAAFEAVVADIGSRIGQTATVQIGVAPSQSDGTGFIGTGGATFLGAGAPAAGIRDGEVYRRIVLGLPDTDPGLDAGLAFDFGYAMALSGTPAPGVSYFPDVARHELTHVLGFGSFLTAAGTGRNGTAPDVYTRFDSFLENSAGSSIVDAGGNLVLSPSDYASAWAAGFYFDGPNARAANGGDRIRLYPGSPSHSVLASDVMYPSPAVGYARDEWTARDIGILRDLGYEVVPEPTTLATALLGASALLRRRRHR